MKSAPQHHGPSSTRSWADQRAERDDDTLLAVREASSPLMPVVVIVSAVSGAGLMVASAAFSVELGGSGSKWVVPAVALLLALVVLGASLIWTARRSARAARRMRAAVIPVEWNRDPADDSSAPTVSMFRRFEDARTRGELARMLAGADLDSSAALPGARVRTLVAVLARAALLALGTGVLLGFVVLLGKVNGSASHTGLLAPLLLGAGSAAAAAFVLMQRFDHAIAVARDEHLVAIAAMVLERWPEDGTDGAITVAGRKVIIDRTGLLPALRKPAPARAPSALPWLLLLGATAVGVAIVSSTPLFS